MVKALEALNYQSPVDPQYFERPFLIIPNNSEKPYALLRKVLEITGLAVIGKVTMSTKERIVLIHYYQNAIVATTLRYMDEVTEPIAIRRDKRSAGGWEGGAGLDEDDSG